MRRGLLQLPRLVLVLAALAASFLSCGRELTGPPDGLRRSGPLSFTPLFPAALRTANGGLHHAVAFEKVRVVFRRSDGGVSLDQTIDFPSDADSVAVRLTVPVSAGAPESGELLALSLYYVDAANDTVFTGGPVPVTVRGAKPGEPPAEPVPVTLTYTGPGREAVRVALSPAVAALTAGQSQTFTTQAFDALDNPLQAPVLFESSDTSIVTVTDAGVATARARRGSAFVIAELYGGAADTSAVSVALPAARIAASSGSGQSGPAGSLLGQNVIVLVTAADSVPVAGVPVSFAATGGGSPGSAVVNTDASGFASTTWTLGAAVGAQTMTATAAGLAGSPVTFTATATPGVPTSLAFTVQPPTAVAGQAMTPSVVVEARTSAGGLATGFTDSVTITLGANPGNDSLFGAMTVAAVGGIATFNNLALDRAATGYSLVASSGSLTSATSASFNVVAANANYLGFEVQPAGGTPGVGMLAAPTVRAYDIFGNPAAFSGNVTVALGANPGGAALGGTTTVTAVAGLATFPGLTISAGGVGYTLVATGTGVFPGTSAPFTVGTATIAWANPGGGPWSVASNWNLNRVPGPTDVVDISLGGTFTVTLDVSPTIAGLEIGTGASGTKTLVATNRTLTLTGDVVVGPNGELVTVGSAIAGSGTLNNDGTVTIANGTLALALDNRGTAVGSGTTAFNGGVSNAPGATLRVAQTDGCCSTATLTIPGGFTNEGTIELSNMYTVAYGAQLNVVGTLVNAPGATIAAIGGQAPGGARGLAADLDNQGTLLVAVPLTLSGAGATHTNSGTIDASADLTIAQSGASPSFTNTGTFTVAAGRTLTVTGGALALVTPIDGAGAVTVNGVTVGITGAVSNAATTLTLVNSTVNGPGTLTNAAGRTLVLYSTTMNAAFVNAGLAIANGTTAINGAFSNPAGATRRVAQVDGCCSTATLTVATGFTNEGTIELSNMFAVAYGAQLNVVGTLVNAVGATIASIGGQTPGGARGLAADLDNQGTLLVAVPLTLGGAGATHTNSGTIDVSANLTLAQSGASPSFTNTGTITVAAGRTLTTTGGAFTQGGTLGGPGTVSWSGVTLAIAVPTDNAVTGIAVTNSTINGPATLTNAAGRTLQLFNSSINAPLVNDGLLIASGNTGIGGAFANSAGATLRVAQLDGCCSTATLAVANGFTNEGTIELSNQTVSAYGAQLNVVGTLVNAIGATITSIGGQTPGGTRGLATDLDNRGTITVEVPLTITGAGATHENSGTIDALANLAITQSGASPSFTNTGTLTVAATRTLTLTGGTFTQAAGTLGGAGTIGLSSTTLAFTTPFTNDVTNLTVAASTINGPATVTNAAGRTLTLVNSTVNAPLVNDGLLVTSGNTAITGALTTSAGSTVRVAQLDGCCGTANLTVATGFTNNGLIELSNQFAVGYGAQLTVTTGTLVNAAAATITAIGGQTPGGPRVLAAQLDNQGNVTAAVPLSISRPNSVHLNAGTIDLTTGGLTVAQSGAASFTNSGAITVGAAQTFAVSGGSFTSTAAATIGGAGTLALQGTAAALDGATPGVAGVTITGGTASFAQPASTAAATWQFLNTTVTSPATFTNAGGRTLSLIGSTLNAPLQNDGTLIVSGASAIGGALTTGAGSLIRVGQVDGSAAAASLTVASGFTNNGAIDLTVVFGVAYNAQLNVTAGTLVNGPGGTISALPGAAPGGQRVLGAELDNQGLVTLLVPMTLQRPSAAHLNSGTIDLTAANLTIQQSGTTPGFVNQGVITLGAGRTLAVNAGSFTHDVDATITGGTLAFQGTTVVFNDATPAVDAISISGGSASFTGGINTTATGFTASGTTLAGPGPLLVAPATTATLSATTVNFPVDVQGTLRASGTTSITGALTTAAGSVLRIGQVDGTSSLAALTVANGFTNAGTIELTTEFPVAYNAQLIVSAGTLVNAPGAVITALGGTTPGGTRTLSAALDNQGTLEAAVPLTINRASADHVSSGTIALTTGDLTITQTGTTPSFVNAGVVTIGAGRTLNVSAGTFTSTAAGSITGGAISANAATLQFQGATPAVAAMSLVNSPTTFAEPVSTAATTFALSATTTLSGPGPFTNAAGRTLTLNGANIAMPFVNEGTLYVSGTSQISGAVSTTAASVIRVGQVDGAASLAHLTVANGFTNNGTIELTTAFAIAYDAQLTVSSGTLLNAAGGTIVSSNGLAGGGTRTIVASGGVDNQGTITVGPGTAGRLAITGSLVTSGVLDLEIGGTVANTGYDVLAVSGVANFGGTLSVSLINGFTPASAQTFAIITRGSGTGTFAFTPPAGIQAAPTYNPTNLTLTGQ